MMGDTHVNVMMPRRGCGCEGKVTSQALPAHDRPALRRQMTNGSSDPAFTRGAGFAMCSAGISPTWKWQSRMIRAIMKISVSPLSIAYSEASWFIFWTLLIMFFALRSPSPPSASLKNRA